MMGVITALRARPRARGRIDVYLDGRRGLTIPLAAASGLRVGMALEAEAVQALEARAAEVEAFEAVGRMLARRPHAVGEVRRRLARGGTAPEVIDRVVDRLVESGDLDDSAFARAWVENRSAFRPRSARMIRAELRQKGVGSEAIDGALAGTDEAEAAAVSAGRAVRLWGNIEPEARRRRLYAHLARRGFDHETIRSVVRSLEGASTEGESEGTR
jgi:regulatory protein